MTKIESEKLLKEFCEYCNIHPEQRFWQALRNWAGVDAICIKTGDSASGYDYWDTFYFINKND